MTLLELCEPLFQYVCRLNRSSRKGGMHDYTHVRAEIEGIFKEMKTNAASRPELITQYEKVELPLMFVVDSMIADSRLSFASNWHKNRLAFDRGELAGDDKFFDLLEETLQDATEPAGERLAIFYVCMGLGFVGAYFDQPQYIRQKMVQCSARMRGMVETDELSRICPDAYEHIDTRNLVEPPGTKLLGIGLALLGLIIVLFVANIVLFSSASRELTGKLQNTINHAHAAKAADESDTAVTGGKE